MRHPTEGLLRRLLDEPAGVPDRDRAHVAGCPQCLAALAEARRDADLVGATLATEGAPDVDAGWRRLTATLPTTGPATGPTTAPAARPERVRPSRSRGFRRPAAAVLAFGVVLAGAGTAAATDWLQVFRTEEVAPLSLSTSDLVALPDLSAYGDVELTGDPDVHDVADAATAAEESRLDVPEVADLPRGVTGEPTISVGGQLSATFTYSADRAAQAAAAAGETLPPPPPGLDGSSVRLVAGPGVAQVWSSESGLPALVVGRAVAPSAYSSGVPFETVRDHLLSLPGLPEDVAAQLRSFTADGDTLPIPVPADLVSSSTAEVDGAEATVLTSRDGAMAAVVWVSDGVVTAVGGSLDTDELLSVARDLR